MTDLTFKRFYLPAWHAACRVHDWRMKGGKLVGSRQASFGGPEVTAMYQRVWLFAVQLTLKANRAITPDDLRHACHIEALDRDKSSKDFTPADTDKVVTVFRLLQNPDNIDAMLDHENPDRMARRRLEWSIKRTPDAYTRAVCAGKFGTRNWENLGNQELRQLVVTLSNRSAKWRRPVRREPVTVDGNPDWTV